MASIVTMQRTHIVISQGAESGTAEEISSVKRQIHANSEEQSADCLACRTKASEAVTTAVLMASAVLIV